MHSVIENWNKGLKIVIQNVVFPLRFEIEHGYRTERLEIKLLYVVNAFHILKIISLCEDIIFDFLLKLPLRKASGNFDAITYFIQCSNP